MSDSLHATHPDNARFDVLVVGDEVESVITAVSAAMAGARVGLLRPAQWANDWLGGLSTRGGLAYMDITPGFESPLFRRFLTEAGVILVALNPERAHQVLHSWLVESDVTVLSGDVHNLIYDNNCLSGLQLADGSVIQAKTVIDATPDADIARLAGLPFTTGLGGLLGPGEPDFLGVSPVFRITGVSRDELIAFEAHLREASVTREQLAALLAEALPSHPEALRQELMTRPVFSPEDMDYIDVLNPLIGIFYHIWRYGRASSYPDARIAIDGGNIARLSDGSLAFNGMVTRITDLETLLALSAGGTCPESLTEEMAAFERYLREVGGFYKARIIPPKALYVRQTLNIQAEQTATAGQMIRGGVPEGEAIGTFSYWLDMRGINLWTYFPGEHLPKPVFNVGLKQSLAPGGRQDLASLGIVSRSAGYSPLGQGAGRIVQHNAMVGEAMGLAAALATQNRTTLRRQILEDMPAIQQAQASRYADGKLPLTGHAVWNDETIAQSKALAADNAVVERLLAGMVRAT